MEPVTIVNRALARIGCLPVQSLAAPGPAGSGVESTYDSVLEDLLSKYPWHFTRRFAALSRLTEVPLGWTSAFMLPPDRLALPRAYWPSPDIAGRPLLAFELATDKVYTGTAACFAEYQAKPVPSHWPGHFRELVVLALAAEYALEIREDQALRERLRRDCYGHPDLQGEGGQFKIAADLDAQARPSQQPAGGANPLTDARGDWWSDPDDARSGW